MTLAERIVTALDVGQTGIWPDMDDPRLVDDVAFLKSTYCQLKSEGKDFTTATRQAKVEFVQCVLDENSS